MAAPAPQLSEIVEAVSINDNNSCTRWKARGEDVIVLSLGEAFFDIPLFGFADPPMPDGYHDSHSRGTPELRRRPGTTR
jgi:aspartate aminotransferase/aminotransferase